MRPFWKLAGLMLLLATTGCGTTRSVLVEDNAGGDAFARIAGRPVEPGDLLEIDLVDGRRLQGKLEQVGPDALWLRVFRGPGDSARPLPRAAHPILSVPLADIERCTLMAWTPWLPLRDYLLIALGLALTTWVSMP